MDVLIPAATGTGISFSESASETSLDLPCARVDMCACVWTCVRVCVHALCTGKTSITASSVQKGHAMLLLSPQCVGWWTVPFPVSPCRRSPQAVSSSHKGAAVIPGLDVPAVPPPGQPEMFLSGPYLLAHSGENGIISLVQHPQCSATAPRGPRDTAALCAPCRS